MGCLELHPHDPFALHRFPVSGGPRRPLLHPSVLRCRPSLRRKARADERRDGQLLRSVPRLLVTLFLLHMHSTVTLHASSPYPPRRETGVKITRSRSRRTTRASTGAGASSSRPAPPRLFGHDAASQPRKGHCLPHPPAHGRPRFWPLPDRRGLPNPPARSHLTQASVQPPSRPKPWSPKSRRRYLHGMLRSLSARAYLPKARLTRVSSRTRPAWGPAC